MLVKKAKVFPWSAWRAGYLTGSGLKDYNKTGKVCGIALPPGLAGFRSFARADVYAVDESGDRPR